MVRKAGRRSWNAYRSGPPVDHKPPPTDLQIDKRRLSTHDQVGMILIASLLFFGVSAILLWAGQRSVPAGIPTGRVTAAFVGIWVSTLLRAYLILLGGIAEKRPSHMLGMVAAPVAIAEAAWILVTCGPKRAARTPAVCALLSVALLAWIAAT